MTVQIWGFTRVMFTIYFAALDSFATILFHFLSKYYHSVTKCFNSRCFFDLTRFIRVYNFKNYLSNHDKQVIKGLFHGKQGMKLHDEVHVCNLPIIQIKRV